MYVRSDKIEKEKISQEGLYNHKEREDFQFKIYIFDSLFTLLCYAQYSNTFYEKYCLNCEAIVSQEECNSRVCF